MSNLKIRKKKYYIESKEKKAILSSTHMKGAARVFIMHELLKCMEAKKPLILYDISVSEAGFMSDILESDDINSLASVQIFDIGKLLSEL